MEFSPDHMPQPVHESPVEEIKQEDETEIEEKKKKIE